MPDEIESRRCSRIFYPFDLILPGWMVVLKKQKQSLRANVMCVGVEITNDLENPSRTCTATDEVKKEMMQVCTIFISSVGSAFSCVALKSNN